MGKRKESTEQEPTLKVEEDACLLWGREKKLLGCGNEMKPESTADARGRGPGHSDGVTTRRGR
jgi:hypothetical protein